MRWLASVAFSCLIVTSAAAQKPTIVLIHGAFADASSWSKVIPILLDDGYTVSAVQIPLTSLPDDVATTKRFLESIKGPFVLVGHSYGGAVITDAGAGNPHLKSLVYVAAFAPDAGEPLTEPANNFPQPDLNAALSPDSAGFLFVDRSKFRDAFCKDLPASDARIAAATQKPVHGSVFTAKVNAAAWKDVPSWYIVSTEDHAINPDLERFYAKRINAKKTEIKSSHVPFLSHPKQVASVIEAAAR